MENTDLTSSAEEEGQKPASQPIKQDTNTVPRARSRYAELPQEALERVQKLEEALNEQGLDVYLVAYRK